MKNIKVFVSENFQFLEVKFSIYLNRCVSIMPKMFEPPQFDCKTYPALCFSFSFRAVISGLVCSQTTLNK